ncbi:hypothetical protein [Bacteroides sp. ET225]|uniref:hypothetical protein n=1 Tax=Bacteroides sp. ET225 TaxID=2972461 RepID=UPI0021ABDEBC|nr:hypothetical protein [Bacteroides sp. ET225]MCR8917469.1 hypothetical protein [Bacteroides sp. ET225]
MSQKPLPEHSGGASALYAGQAPDNTEACGSPASSSPIINFTLPASFFITGTGRDSSVWA